MALPSFVVTGNLKEMLGISIDDEIAEQALSRARIIFRCNLPSDVLIHWDGTIYPSPRDVIARIDTNGNLIDINGDDPVRLLAAHDDWDFNHLQWKIILTLESTVIPAAAFAQMRSWSIDAAADGQTVDLETTLPVPSVTIAGITRGPDGAPVDDVDRDGNFIQFFVEGNQIGEVDISDLVFDGTADSISDATPIGKALIRAASTFIARSAINAAGGGNLIAVADDGQDTIIDDGGLVVRNPLFIDATQAPYGIKFDCYTSTLASMSSSSNPTHLTVGGYTFTAADVGKLVKVVGAAAASANLKTTITGISAGKAVLDSPCLTTVSNTYVMFGTDNEIALNQLFEDLTNMSRDRKLSRTVVMPIGVAMHTGTLVYPGRGTVRGAGDNWIEYFNIYGRWGAMEEHQGSVLYQVWDQNVDCGRLRDINNNNNWNGMLQGFSVVQDWENTAGRGISFRDTDGDPLTIIDGGTVNRVAAMGTAEEGWDFAGGCVTASLRDVQAFACGYAKRKFFTCDTVSGSVTLSNVSSFTDLAIGDVIVGPGLPIDSVIEAINSGAGTVSIMRSATATATGISVQRTGAPGIRYSLKAFESVHFDGPSGDQNSGGLLRIQGADTTGWQTGTVTITNLKNEYGVNVYREPGADVSYNSIPQGVNAVVLRNLASCSISIRGLVHWADASSSVGATNPNPQGKDAGAAILVLPGSANAPQVTWETLSVHLADGSGQTTKFAYRDCHDVFFALRPIDAGISGRGANRQLPLSIRGVSDANATVTAQDAIVYWSSMTAARVATLPLISAVPAGHQIRLIDGFGSATSVRTITATPSGSDVIFGDSVIDTALGQIVLMATTAGWIGILTGKAAVATYLAPLTATWTNKRINPRILAMTTSAVPVAPDIASCDQLNINALDAALTFSAPTGSPTNGHPLVIRVKDNGTARALTWNAIYRAIGVTLPTTTVISKVLYIFMRYNANDSKWDVIDVKQEA